MCGFSVHCFQLLPGLATCWIIPLRAWGEWASLWGRSTCQSQSEHGQRNKRTGWRGVPVLGTRASLLVARTLLVAPGLSTRNKKLLVTKGISGSSSGSMPSKLHAKQTSGTLRNVSRCIWCWGDHLHYILDLGQNKAVRETMHSPGSTEIL